MPETMTFQITGTIDSEAYIERISVEGTNIERCSPSIAAAKNGTLTTRTDANTGSLTMSASHGITDGVKLDLFWVGGSRRDMTVGTVSTNVVPIDLGSGDDLPIATTVITAMIPVLVVFNVASGDAAKGFAVSSPKAGYVSFVDGDNADITAAIYQLDAGEGKSWATGNGVTNPLASSVVAKVKFSHGDSTAARTMKAAVIFGTAP